MDLKSTNGVRLLPLAVFNGTYLVAAIIATLLLGNAEFVFYIVVMLVLIAVVMFAHSKVGFTGATLWCLSFWGLLHMAGGLVPVPQGLPVNGEQRVLYSLWIIPHYLKYDQIIHAFGFGVTTWVCWQGMRAALSRSGDAARPTFGLMVLAAAAGMGFGALNEIVEFIAVLLVPETNVGGYVNTGWDLVSNFIGSTIAGVTIYTTGRK